MKVAFKLIGCVVIGVIVLVSIDAAISLRRETNLFRAEMHNDAQTLGYTLKDVVMGVWSRHGEDRALALIKDANREQQRIHVRWVWLNTSEAGFEPRVAPTQIHSELKGNTHVSVVSTDDQQRETLYTYIPVDVGDPRLGAIELWQPMSYLHNYTDTSKRQTLILGVGLIVGSAIAACLLGIQFIGRPLDLLMTKLARIGGGDLSGPLKLKRHDEFGKLGEALNNMCEALSQSQRQLEAESAARIKTVEQLRHTDRLRTVGQLSAGVAHELGTPLNVVAEHARIIQAESDQESDITSSARVIEQQSDRMTGIVSQLLEFARRRPAEKVTIDVSAMVRETVKLLRPLAEKRQVRVNVLTNDHPVKTFGFKQQLQQVLTNLIDNAVEASPPNSDVIVQVNGVSHTHPLRTGATARDYVQLNVRDQGKGIADENMERLFEPFFTTKDVGEGTGLGLSIAYTIVEEHGGWIEVSSDAGGETCFSVNLPICGSDSSPSGQNEKLNVPSNRKT